MTPLATKSSAPCKSERRGRWDVAASRFEFFMSEFSHCASNTDCRFDPIYSSLFTIRDLLRKQALREDEMLR
jgi:hypothetical protein